MATGVGGEHLGSCQTMTGLRNRLSRPELDSPSTTSDPAAAETDRLGHTEVPGRAGSAFSK
jgi:hypothetical protein